MNAKNRGKKIKIVLFAGYACNNHCVFCMEMDKRALPQRTTAELVREIYLAKKKGADILEIIGGEVTIRPDFPRIVRLAKKIGIPEVICSTNGRAFSDPGFAAGIVAAGIDALIFSVHGPTPAVHDALTGSPGSFRQLCAGLRNLKKLGFRNINGNTVVVKGNMSRMADIAAFYAANKVRNVEYIFVDPNGGGAYNDFKKLVPRISRAAPHMRRALAIGRAAGFDQWKVRYVPLCHFQDCLGQISETNERELFLAEHWAQDFRNTDAIGSRAVVGRKKTSRCRGCRLFSECEGIWTEYLERCGDSELKAVP